MSVAVNRPIRTVGVVVHAGKPRAVQAAGGVRQWAAERGLGCSVVDDWAADQGGRLTAAEESERAGRPELVVTIGGDGTFLRGVRVAAVTDALVLGVDVGRVGFLTESPVSELRSALDQVIAGGCEVDERLMLTMCASRPLTIPPGLDALVRYGRGPQLPPPPERERHSADPESGVPLDVLALNDIVFEKLARDRQADADVFINGRRFISYSADAVIVSTPTGSTAYSFAAGGPILSPHMDGLVFTPVAPHQSFNRSVVLGGDERISVQVMEGSGEVAVSVDGAMRGVLDAGDWITVYAAATRARLVRFADFDFLERVRNKLGLSDAAAAVADRTAPENRVP